MERLDVALSRSMLEGLFETWLSREETQGQFDDWIALAEKGQLEAPDEAKRLRELHSLHSPRRAAATAASAAPAVPPPPGRPPAPASPQASSGPKPKPKPPHTKLAEAAKALAPLRSLADDLESGSVAAEQQLREAWAKIANSGSEAAGLPKAHFGLIAELCHLPKLLGPTLFAKVHALEAKAAKDKENAASPKAPTVSLGAFLDYFRKELRRAGPKQRLFTVLARKGADSIVKEDWVPLLETLVNEHAGLQFLQDHAEFQQKYAMTCVARLYYRVNLSRTGRISRRELACAEPCVLAALQRLDADDDVNRELAYFSYEHFYVLYCRFWELDADRDALVTRDDLLKYGGHRLSRAIVDRIFDAAPRPYGDGDCGGMRRRAAEQRLRREAADDPGAKKGGARRRAPVSPDSVEDRPAGEEEGSAFGDYSDDDSMDDDDDGGGSDATDEAAGSARGRVSNSAGRDRARKKPRRHRREHDSLSYADFVYFMLSEEDKGNEAAMRYWFACCDLDGDGTIDGGDARHFYRVQAQRMQGLGHEAVPFDDVICQMSDMLHPKSLASRADGAPMPLKLTLADVLRPCKLRSAGSFFDALFSLDKFVDFEQRDPFMERLKRDDAHASDWDRFAASEYARLATEDDANTSVDGDYESVHQEDRGRAAEAPF
ncbi:hypothetical protein M885DRAFT_497035 [Pelagophyceae sp. CCMP2097]|nr:hypothetical protein M885DRAFT_497035 [Pelagophyceae sp. CCMP2097]